MAVVAAEVVAEPVEEVEEPAVALQVLAPRAVVRLLLQLPLRDPRACWFWHWMAKLRCRELLRRTNR